MDLLHSQAEHVPIQRHHIGPLPLRERATHVVHVASVRRARCVALDGVFQGDQLVREERRKLRGDR
eukprot:1037-Eustigmatos_ZCMA.PRE.1